MSLTAQTEAGAGVGMTATQVPRLTASNYAAWRPVMENLLMRSGVTSRDYKTVNADWATLVAAVEQWTVQDETASIAYALGRVSASAATAKDSKAGPSADEEKMRRGATEIVARTKKAYTLLYQALSDELRRLVTSVPQGDAYGLWNWLEKRFQNTEQDNVGDLWDQFTSLVQYDDELFEEYKARVDHVYNLLSHAKDKPSPGLYAHRVLWKLTPHYQPAVLALQNGDKVKVADKINWVDIVSYINSFERGQQRLASADASTDGHGMVNAIRGRRAGPGLGDMKCYNCQEKGHYARDCKNPRRERREDEDEDDREDRTRDREDRHQDREDRNKNREDYGPEKRKVVKSAQVRSVTTKSAKPKKQTARCSTPGGPGGYGVGPTCDADWSSDSDW